MRAPLGKAYAWKLEGIANPPHTYERGGVPDGAVYWNIFCGGWEKRAAAAAAAADGEALNGAPSDAAARSDAAACAEDDPAGSDAEDETFLHRCDGSDDDDDKCPDDLNVWTLKVSNAAHPQCHTLWFRRCSRRN